MLKGLSAQSAPLQALLSQIQMPYQVVIFTCIQENMLIGAMRIRDFVEFGQTNMYPPPPPPLDV